MINWALKNPDLSTPSFIKSLVFFIALHFLIAEAKKIADQAMKDPMSLVNNVGALKFW